CSAELVALRHPCGIAKGGLRCRCARNLERSRTYTVVERNIGFARECHELALLPRTRRRRPRPGSRREQQAGACPNDQEFLRTNHLPSQSYAGNELSGTQLPTPVPYRWLTLAPHYHREQR